MRIWQIYDFLNEISPFELQEEWDNSGLLVGDFNDDVRKIYLTLDLTEEILEEVEENSLIIAHHPLIFKPLKNLVPTTFSTKLAVKLIKKNVAFIAMHTNFDKTHLNAYVARKILGLEGENDGFVFKARINKTFDEFKKHVKEKLGLKCVKSVKCNDFIKTVSLTTGAGMSLLPYVDSDLFLTGDIKYHEAMEAKLKGVSLLDIGHFESERFFSEILYEKIDFIETVKLDMKNPFEYD